LLRIRNIAPVLNQLSANAQTGDLMRGMVILTAGVAVIAFGLAAAAKEYPIGKAKKVDAAGMEVAAVYLQPIEMEPPGMMREAKDSDIHLEADIKALKDNKNGYAEGDWIGYLKVTYELTKAGETESIKGDAMPMVADDGPHYGDNVKLHGPGKYKLKFSVAPPGHEFGRHVDKETGVGPWFKPFTVEYDFTYAGVGKKGAY
jgi:uncharacterized protein involved in high-affinity Fe2+ transport